MLKKHLVSALVIGAIFGTVSTTEVNANMKDSYVSEYTVATTDLNGIGGTQQYQNQQGGNIEGTPPSQSNQESANVVGDLFSQNGINAENQAKANTFVAPLANLINTVASFILGITCAMLLLITVADFTYLSIPPLRGVLNPESNGGGMGGGMMGSPNSGGSAKKRWVSDEAIACVGGGSNGGMSPMGGGMSPMGGGQESPKNAVVTYLKKRTVFLIVFAICVVLFTSTIFTDLGVKIGTMLLGWITGMSASVPM